MDYGDDDGGDGVWEEDEEDDSGYVVSGGGGGPSIEVSTEDQPYGRFKVIYNGIVILCRCTNAANTFNLGPYIKKINIKKVAEQMKHLGAWCNEDYFPMVVFHLSSNMECLKNVFMKNVAELRENNLPERKRSIHQTSTIMMFSSGITISTGSVDQEMGMINAYRFCYMLANNCGLPVRMSDFKLTNQVVICNLPFNVNLARLSSSTDIAPFVDYDPNVFIMAVVHLDMYPGAAELGSSCPTALISSNGSVNLAGLLRKDDVVTYLRIIMPHLLLCHVDDGTAAYKSETQRELDMLKMQSDSAAHTWRMFCESWNQDFDEDTDVMTILNSQLGGDVLGSKMIMDFNQEMLEQLMFNQEHQHHPPNNGGEIVLFGK